MSTKSVLVFGSAGAMGRSVFVAFKAKGWNVVGVDLAAAAKANPALVTVPLLASPTPGVLVPAQEELLRLLDAINSTAKISEFHAVVNAAGGWAGGGAASKDIAETTELMWTQSVRSSIACSHIATTLGVNTKSEGVFLVLTGSAATAGPTAGMLAYGTAKAAVNHIAKSVSEELAGINPLASAVCISPVTIDTPGNRAGMPGADFSNWTPCDELSGKIVGWSDGSQTKPKNGSNLKVETKAGKTTWSPLF